MIMAGSVAPQQALPALERHSNADIGEGPLAESSQTKGARFAATLAAIVDGAAGAIGAADNAAAALASGKGDVATAAIARAKADVALEIASVAASRVSAAIAALMQTQA
jgi:flagellar hook-basal body complex protein FliE